MKLRCTALVVGSLLTAPALTAQQSPDALAAALQKKYDSIRDFSADFSQVSQSVLKRKTTPERGTVWIKKPGKMRWDYKQPEEKYFISDGDKIYLFTPRDKQVYVSSVPAGDTAPTPILFLAGKGNIVRDFSATDAPTPPEFVKGTVALKLTPKTPQPEYEWLIVGMEPGTFVLRGIVWADAQGGANSIVFTNIKENIRPPESRFEFTPPKGVDVLTDGGR